MISILTKQELESRLNRLCIAISATSQNWETVLLFSKINQYYFTGTMQDGVLIVKKDGTYGYYVRRSYERAKAESALDKIYPMESYKDVVKDIGEYCGKTYIETDVVTINMLERVKKYFLMDEINSIDKIIQSVRAIKSAYELYFIEESGIQHKHLLENIVPTLLREGVNEAELTAEIFEQMIKLGHHGVTRFSMFQTEAFVGQIAFGINSLYPTSFNGPGGMLGMSPAVPIIGNRERHLKKGDLIFIDVGYGINGYHTDKTQVYMFGGELSKEVVEAHRRCIDIENRVAELLKPGNIPSEIYNNIMGQIDESFLDNFMGFGYRKVKFLGHGVGLYIDELPAIANGFVEPLAENMVIAIEPKKGLAGIGMVGVEDTYLVTSGGGKCLTGGGRDIIVV